MKIKYFLSVLFLGGAFMGMTSCSDDNDSNPTLKMPESFVLNSPALAQTVIDLESSIDSIHLNWSQPDYGGMPLVTTYYIQYAVDENFSSTKDDEGNEVPNYIQEDEPVSECKGAIAIEDLNRNLIKLLGINSADELPQQQDVFVRVTAQTYSTGYIYSNIVKLVVQPYFQSLVAADPVLWYLTGSCIGDGSWQSTVPTGCMPMYFSNESTYNEVDGTGEIVWAGYLTPDGFKFRGSPDDNWAVQIGQGDAFGEFKLNDGGSANISVPEAGCYKVVLDTKTNQPTITPFEGRVRIFDSISLSGSFNEWSDTEMTPVTTVGENHDWYLQIELNEADEIKFKETGSWDNNWGWGGLFNLSYGWYGFGEGNGGNFYIAETGTYDIFFNDLLGLFRIVKQ